MFKYQHINISTNILNISMFIITVLFINIIINTKILIFYIYTSNLIYLFIVLIFM